MTGQVGDDAGNTKKDDKANDAVVSLPDPSYKAKKIALLILFAAALLALFLDLTNWDHDPPFDPTGPGAPVGGNFGIFAGFFIAATVIERILELFSPQVPFWGPARAARQAAKTRGADAKTRLPVIETPEMIAQKKADRGYVMLAVAAFVGTALSAGLGLYFLKVVGMSEITRGVDIFISGMFIGGGTKVIHELVKSLEAVKASGGGTTAG